MAEGLAALALERSRSSWTSRAPRSLPELSRTVSLGDERTAPDKARVCRSEPPSACWRRAALRHCERPDRARSAPRPAAGFAQKGQPRDSALRDRYRRRPVTRWHDRFARNAIMWACPSDYCFGLSDSALSGHRVGDIGMARSCRCRRQPCRPALAGEPPGARRAHRHAQAHRPSPAVSAFGTPNHERLIARPK
jgi:hypothetical protein